MHSRVEVKQCSSFVELLLRHLKRVDLLFLYQGCDHSVLLRITLLVSRLLSALAEVRKREKRRLPGHSSIQLRVPGSRALISMYSPTHALFRAKCHFCDRIDVIGLSRQVSMAIIQSAE
jgi:hypothetical protein